MSTITTMATDIQERLSIAYVTAVAARAGCQIIQPPLDRNGLDLTIQPISGAPVQIDVQLKSVTTNIRIDGGKQLSYQLDTKTYDKLRRTDVQSPHLLVVYEMPPDQKLWLGVDYPTTTLQHAAYWTDLRGLSAVSTASTAIHLPVENLFDHNAIQTILERAHARAREGLSWA